MKMHLQKARRAGGSFLRLTAAMISGRAKTGSCRARCGMFISARCGVCLLLRRLRNRRQTSKLGDQTKSLHARGLVHQRRSSYLHEHTPHCSYRTESWGAFIIRTADSRESLISQIACFAWPGWPPSIRRGIPVYFLFITRTRAGGTHPSADASMLFLALPPRTYWQMPAGESAGPKSRPETHIPC
jgi:hypothetical protein